MLFFSCEKSTSNAKRTKQEMSISPSDWMHQILLKYSDKDISLVDLAVPGSHDAGMYVTNLCSFGANDCNTQTQYLPMKQQLEAGLRIFDLRPVYANGKYFTQHVTNCDGLGCKGDLLNNIFSQTNEFLNQHAEFIIFHFSHFCNTSALDTSFIELLNHTFQDKIYKETLSSNIPFIQQSLKNIIPTDKNTGKVMFVFDDGLANTSENRANGFFAGNIIPIQGGWSNSSTLADLKEKQLAYYSNFINDKNSLFQISWQVTQNETQAITCAINPQTPLSIQDMAKNANKELTAILDTLIMQNDIRKGRIPNIIYFDFADQNSTLECLKINAINLE